MNSSTPHCDNCSCPKKSSLKRPIPRFTGGDDEPQVMALFMAQSVHDTVMAVMTGPEEYGGLYKGRLSLHFEYDPVYMRDQLVTTWEPRD